MVYTSGLYTDMYELTMAQGYFLTSKQDETAVFDYFFRKNPYDGGYTVFAGLWDMLQALKNFKFGPKEMEYLRDKGFQDPFLKFLADFRFTGDLYAVKEGEVVFPGEPLLRIEGTLIETQLVESLILNILNFESLIATKAQRIREVAGERIFSDFGLRRAQGMGSLQASRAAAIGGANATSNVLAGYHNGLEITGTQAHSWIQSFDTELEAFRKFTQVYPENAILLVDTYDTLKSGIPNVITVARELEASGHRIAGIRLDSGDLAYLSKKAREMLDEAGLSYIKIIVSNQLDEFVIRSLNLQQAPIDGFGIGTRMITGMPDAALDGVYKLSVLNDIPKLKISDNVEKITLPGRKELVRFTDRDGFFAGDGIVLTGEKVPEKIYHPTQPRKFTDVSGYKQESLYSRCMKEGEITIPFQQTMDINRYVKERFVKLPEEHKRFEYPHIYKVGISEKLMTLCNNLVNDRRNRK